MFLSAFQQVKRVLRVLGGFALLSLGILLFVTPVPGWLLIAAALGILAAEFEWARRLLSRLKAQGVRLRSAVFARGTSGDV